MRICIITCYNQPDYVRAVTLRAAAELVDGAEVIVLKNRHKGLLRYPEVFMKVLVARFKHKPDVYLLTFRGYEMLLPVRLLSLGKPMIYDEFINPIEWVVKERRQVEAKQTSAKIYRLLVAIISRFIVMIVGSWPFAWFYRQLVKATDVVLADTASHADISAELTGVPRSKIVDIPVGVDEATFEAPVDDDAENEMFTVFYYGNMLPLHGLEYVIDAAVKMNHEAVRFVLVGGSAKVAHDVAFAIGNGANIDYKAWVEFDTLPTLMSQADLCLAGPFGGTFQAEYVITGKAFQYLAMGRPTVVGMNRESDVFTHQKDALVVRQGNVDALVESIRWAMNNRTQLRSIGRAGRKLYEERYATKHLSKRLAAVLARLDGPRDATTHTDEK